MALSNLVIVAVMYEIGKEPVTIVTENAFGGRTNIYTTQTALATAAGASAWGDDAVKSVCDAQVTTEFSGMSITTSLNQPS